MRSPANNMTIEGVSPLVRRPFPRVFATDGFQTSTQGVVVLALMVFVVYFIGSLVGMKLRLPPSIPSVVWPPNSLLTTALLFTPLSRWRVVLLAALPAHLILQYGTWPFSLVSALYLTNCSEALIAAGLIRRFSDSPTRFDTLRSVIVFIVSAVVVAPVVSSFLDAGAVAVINEESFWAVWKVRLLSNMLAALAIIPAAAGLLHTGWKRVLQWPARRWVETGLVTAFLIVALLGSTHLSWSSPLARLPNAALLPLLLWTSLRFGPAGAGLSLLAMVLVLVGDAALGRGPLLSIPVEERVPIIQTLLIAAAIPFMCVAGLIAERRKTEDALRASDATKSAILASLPSHVAVLDRTGRVIAANDDWVGFALSIGMLVEPSPEPRVELHPDPIQAPDHIRHMADGLRRVVEDAEQEFAFEYSPPGEPERWYSVSVVPLKHLGGGAVLTHTNVTERRRAELTAQRSREELAHTGRVWVLGELTASLSHQLSQPLTAIAGNANAGSRLLRAGRQDTTELADIFADISADAARAAEVIRGVRELLRKGTSYRETLDINELVARTIHLVRSESVMRKVAVRLHLTGSMPSVLGNRVQLQQVVLNLFINALDAAATAEADRVVTIRTFFDRDHGVSVAVHDTGGGLGEGNEQTVFEPFYTTKQSGMGMGLAIARSIVEAHGGVILANSSPRGAVFTFTLPVLLTAEEQPQ